MKLLTTVFELIGKCSIIVVLPMDFSPMESGNYSYIKIYLITFKKRAQKVDGVRASWDSNLGPTMVGTDKAMELW